MTQATRTKRSEVDRRLDECERLFLAYSLIPRWKFIKKHLAENRWLLAVGALERAQRDEMADRRGES